MTDQERCPLCGSIPYHYGPTVNCNHCGRMTEGPEFDVCGNSGCNLPVKHWPAVRAKNDEIEGLKQRVKELEIQLDGQVEEHIAADYEVDKLKQRLAAFARQQLAETPDAGDDGDPVTAEWLAKRMKPSELSPLVYGYSKCCRGVTLRIEPHRESWAALIDQDDASIDLGPIKTRGDVRNLCKALGVELEGE